MWHTAQVYPKQEPVNQEGTLIHATKVQVNEQLQNQEPLNQAQTARSTGIP